jgi:3-hydroxybutyrate dehydrogenase
MNGMSGLVENRVALVTGAARGIGREIARTLAAEGAQVVVADLDHEGASQAAETLRDEGFEAVAVGCDVGDEAQVRRAVEAALGSFGGLDILVNNAGLQHVAPIEEFPTGTFERMLRVMVIGPFLGIKHATPAMKAQGRGRILTIASINGLVGFAGKSAYNAAKHGAIGLTKVAALELASRDHCQRVVPRLRRYAAGPESTPRPGGDARRVGGPGAGGGDLSPGPAASVAGGL